jgi:hypothetical protein
MKWETIDELMSAEIPKRPFWHYTSLDAFRQIIESCKMFATSASYLNDLKEVTHAREIANEFLQTEIYSTRPTEVVRQTFNRLLDDVELQFLVLCFSTERNQLSQWRAYSGASSGVSLGFDLTKIRQGLDEEHGLTLEHDFAPCVYCDEDKRHLIQCAIRPVLDTKEMDFNITAAVINLLRVSPFLKNRDFYEEREWRLVFRTMAFDRLSFRSGRSSLIPYIEQTMIVEDRFTNVMLGPGSDAPAEKAMRLFLRKDWANIEIGHSNIPYLPR